MKQQVENVYFSTGFSFSLIFSFVLEEEKYGVVVFGFFVVCVAVLVVLVFCLFGF